MFRTQRRIIIALLVGGSVAAAVSPLAYYGLVVPPAQAADEPAKAPRAGAVTLLRVPDGGIQPQVAVDGRGVTIRGAHLAMGKNGRVHVAWIGSGKAGPMACRSGVWRPS